MKNFGEARRRIRHLEQRVERLESQMEVIIDTFCKDAFEDFEPPKDDNPFKIDPNDLQLGDEDIMW